MLLFPALFTTHRERLAGMPGRGLPGGGGLESCQAEEAGSARANGNASGGSKAISGREPSAVWRGEERPVQVSPPLS